MEYNLKFNLMSFIVNCIIYCIVDKFISYYVFNHLVKLLYFLNLRVLDNRRFLTSIICFIIIKMDNGPDSKKGSIWPCGYCSGIGSFIWAPTGSSFLSWAWDPTEPLQSGSIGESGQVRPTSARYFILKNIFLYKNVIKNIWIYDLPCTI